MSGTNNSLPSTSSKLELSTLKVDGKEFRCEECGSNVFMVAPLVQAPHRVVAKCNACGALYEGEAKHAAV